MSPDDPQGLPGLEARIEALEAYVARNDARISFLEQWGAQAAADLAQDVEAVKEANRRAKWIRTLRR